jgi:hypothetical protein
LVAQNTFLQNNRNVTVNNFRNTNITNIRNITNVTALASLPQLGQQGVSLQRLTADQVTRERKDAQRFHSLGQDRAKLEARVRSQGSPLSRGNEAKGPVRMDFPALKATTKASAAVRGAPPQPNIPNPRAHDAATERTRKPAETINPRGTRTDGARTGAGEERRNLPGKDAGRPTPEPRRDIIKPRDEGKPTPRDEGKPKAPPPEHKSGSPPPHTPETRKAPPPEPKKPPPSEGKKAPPPEHKPGKEKPPDK